MSINPKVENRDLSLRKRTEIFDFVNCTDQVIGAASREHIHAHNFLHRAVHLYARGDNGGLILQKRSLSKDLEPGLWTVSCSGHVDHGESYLQAALREMGEELGIYLKKCQLNELLRSDPSKQTGNEFIRSYEVMNSICPNPSPCEISEVCEIDLCELDEWMTNSPESFSSSFRHLFPMARKKFILIK